MRRRQTGCKAARRAARTPRCSLAAARQCRTRRRCARLQTLRGAEYGPRHGNAEPDGGTPLPPAARRRVGDHSGTMPICLRARPARSIAQRVPQFAWTVPRPRRRGAPLRRVAFARGRGRRAAHASVPAPAHGQPGPIRCRRARRRAQSVRPSAAQSARDARRRAGGFPFVVRALYCAASPGSDSGEPIPGLQRRPVRARRTPAAHRSRETRRPACRSAGAPQGAARSSNAGLRPQAAGAAAGPDPHSQRRRNAVRPVHKPPARCPCTLRPPWPRPRPALEGACTSAEPTGLDVQMP